MNIIQKIMSLFSKIIQKIMSLFSKDKIETTMVGTNISKKPDETVQYHCWVQDMQGNKIGNTDIQLTIAGKDYHRETKEDGVIELPIRLNKVGDYKITAIFNGNDKYKPCSIENNIHISHKKTDTKIKQMNANIIQGDKNRIALTTSEGRPLKDKEVVFSIGGKEYKYNTDNMGIAGLTIRLKPNIYDITYSFKGDANYKSVSLKSKITVTEKKNNAAKKSTTKSNTSTKTIKPNSKGEYWSPRYLSNGEEKQSTNYYCLPVSVMQAVYELTGKDLSQRWLADIMGTTTAGTGHQGVTKALNQINKKYGYNLKHQWKYFSDIGWKKLAEYVKDPNVGIIIHGGWAELGTWNFEAGHYYCLACVNPSKEYAYEIYSLRGATLQKRSFSYLRASMNYISQPSICIITKN